MFVVKLNMLHAPTAFEGYMSELYRVWLAPSLPSVENVRQLDTWMNQYRLEDCPVFPVRAIRGTLRRARYSTIDGTVIAPADNSPAWVVHALLVHGQIASYVDFRDLMQEVPVHMFDIKRLVRWTANDYGWYVAHVVATKNGDTNFRCWTRREVERRFYLTLHPCNLFFIPGVRNRMLGEDPAVIAFVAHQFSMRYGTLWDEFLARVAPEGFSRARVAVPDDFLVRYPSDRRDHSVESGQGLPPGSGLVRARYKASRLTFKRDAIEPLGPNEVFEVVTPMGTYRFSKSEFYGAFPRIPRTLSYREGGRYHGARLHVAAERFRVGL